MAGPPRCLLLKQILAILGIISGISICVSFAHLKNVNASLWGLLSAIFAAILLHLHVSYRRRKLHLRYSPECLRTVKLMGLILTFTTIIAAIVYFVLAAVYHQGYKVEGNGYAPAGTFALLSMKWTLMMFFQGRTYERFLIASTSETSPIPNGEAPPPYEGTRP